MGIYAAAICSTVFALIRGERAALIVSSMCLLPITLLAIAGRFRC
jgi:hypothetical protein